MPFIVIKALPNPNKRDSVDMLTGLASKIASEELAAPLDAVLCVFEEIVPGWYAHAGKNALGRSSQSHPPLILIHAYEGRTDAQIESCILRIAHELAPKLGVSPQNMFVNFQEIQAGRLYSKGQIKWG